MNNIETDNYLAIGHRLASGTLVEKGKNYDKDCGFLLSRITEAEKARNLSNEEYTELQRLRRVETLLYNFLHDAHISTGPLC